MVTEADSLAWTTAANVSNGTLIAVAANTLPPRESVIQYTTGYHDALSAVSGMTTFAETRNIEMASIL
jgi:hypothetical protein